MEIKFHSENEGYISTVTTDSEMIEDVHVAYANFLKSSGYRVDGYIEIVEETSEEIAQMSFDRITELEHVVQKAIETINDGADNAKVVEILLSGMRK